MDTRPPRITLNEVVKHVTQQVEGLDLMIQNHSRQILQSTKDRDEADNSLSTLNDKLDGLRQKLQAEKNREREIIAEIEEFQQKSRQEVNLEPVMETENGSSLGEPQQLDSQMASTDEDEDDDDDEKVGEEDDDDEEDEEVSEFNRELASLKRKLMAQEFAIEIVELDIRNTSTMITRIESEKRFADMFLEMQTEWCQADLNEKGRFEKWLKKHRC